jgi:hypothetical protein
MPDLEPVDSRCRHGHQHDKWPENTQLHEFTEPSRRRLPKRFYPALESVHACEEGLKH